MIMASAQLRVERANLFRNMEKHVLAVEKASGLGAEFILFPEMSLTGYERLLAADQAVTPGDARLAVLREAVAAGGITAAVGAPLLLGNALYIGTLVFTPAGDERIYVKQYLHPGEEDFFRSSFDLDPIVNVGGETVSFAVCYDIENAGHPAKAREAGASAYAAGIFYSSGGMDGAHRTLSGYALKYSMTVIMSNFCGACWESLAGGRSALWDNTGEKIIEAGPDEEVLLVARRLNGGWTGKRIRLDR